MITDNNMDAPVNGLDEWSYLMLKEMRPVFVDSVACGIDAAESRH